MQGTIGLREPKTYQFLKVDVNMVEDETILPHMMNAYNE